MATAPEPDPLASFRFMVKVDNLRAGFAEISGLSTNPNVVQFRRDDMHPAIRQLPDHATLTSIVCKHGFSPDGRELLAWWKMVIDGNPQRRSGSITLLDDARTPALVWQFAGGWPSKWDGPALNAKNNEIAIETLEICIEGLTLRA